MKSLFALVILFSLFFTGCSGTKIKRRDVPQVPMAIDIKANASPDFMDVDIHYYKLKAMDILDDFQDVELILVDADENPQIILDLTIDNFNIWPKDERISNKVYSRSIRTGTSSGGQPIYQTVTATAEAVQTQIRSNARLISKLSFKGDPSKVYQKSFSPSYVWQNIDLRNILGDTRAIDPSIPLISIAIEPMAADFLLSLSNQDMLKDLSYELSKYYRNPKK